MSVQSIGGSGLPDPAAYTYSGSPPAGLAGGSATAPAAPASESDASAASPYQKEYATLQQQDAAELLTVSLGSASDASANVASVLAQATALQTQQLAAQQQAQGAAASAVTITQPDVPTFEQITGQSDSDAANALSQFQTPPDPGSSVDTLA